MSHELEIRPSPIAGMWYSGNPQRLKHEVNNYISQANLPELQGDVLAIIAPHAGHRYSGQTAGYAFRTLKGKSYDLAAVISPIHSFSPQPILTTAHQAYATPLGALRVDQQALQELDQNLAGSSHSLNKISKDGEHSLEIELPFLQQALEGEFKLLPLMISGKNPTVAETLGHALANVVRKRNAILVASTDLSHFYPEKTGNQLDEEMLRQIESLSPEGVLTADRTGAGLACGAAAVATVLWAAIDLGADAVQILHHSNSGDVTGDYSSVVGYGAAAVLKTQ